VVVEIAPGDLPDPHAERILAVRRERLCPRRRLDPVEDLTRADDAGRQVRPGSERPDAVGQSAMVTVSRVAWGESKRTTVLRSSRDRPDRGCRRKARAGSPRCPCPCLAPRRRRAAKTSRSGSCAAGSSRSARGSAGGRNRYCQASGQQGGQVTGSRTSSAALCPGGYSFCIIFASSSSSPKPSTSSGTSSSLATVSSLMSASYDFGSLAVGGGRSAR
jgi:hypothetical protein